MGILRRLHSDEGAQVTFLAVAAALCFVGLFSMIMNTNDLLRHRMQVQEAADVTALSAATWNARGMNLVSMVNVINSKLLTMTVLAKSLNDTLKAVNPIATAQITAFTACTPAPFVGAFCAVMATVVKVQQAVLKVLQSGMQALANQSKCNKSSGFFKVMSGLQSIGEGIKLSFPGLAIAESNAIATANYVEGFALQGGLITRPTSPTQGVQLPLKDGEEGTKSFCQAMNVGGPGYVMEGYDEGQGPMKLGKRIWDLFFIPFFNLAPHPIFYGFHTAYMAEIGCPPGEKYDGDSDDETPLDNLGECRRFYADHDTEATWYQYEAWTNWSSSDSVNLASYTPWKPKGVEDGEEPDTSDMDAIEDQFREACLEEAATNPDIAPEDCSGGGTSQPYTPKFAEETDDPKDVDVDCDSVSRGYPNLGPEGDRCVIDTGPSCTRLRIERSDFVSYGISTENVGAYYMKSVDVEENDDGEYRHHVYIWTLGSAGKAELSAEEQSELVQDRAGQSPPPAQTQQGCKSLVAPLLYDEATNGPNRLRQMAFTWIDLTSDGVGRPFWSGFFDDPPERVTAYAQAQVYNELAPDNYDKMFTQDWRVRLEQAGLLSEAMDIGEVVNLGAFDKNAIGGFLDTVNNH